MAELTGWRYTQEFTYRPCVECSQDQLDFALDKEGKCYYCNGSIVNEKTKTGVA